MNVKSTVPMATPRLAFPAPHRENEGVKWNSVLVKRRVRVRIEAVVVVRDRDGEKCRDRDTVRRCFSDGSK
jgi:hypothetical protein